MTPQEQKTLAALKHLSPLVESKLLASLPEHRENPAFEEFEEMGDMLEMLIQPSAPAPTPAQLTQVLSFWEKYRYPYRYWGLKRSAAAFKKQDAAHIRNLKIALGMKP